MTVRHRAGIYNHTDLGGILTHAGEGREHVRRPSARTWFEIRNAQRGGEGPTYAEVYLYDEISMWGISAAEFIGQLNALDVEEIDLHINSPGGDLFEGVAIYQALVQHPATVYAYVDALAASIASVIAMAGDRVTMAPLSRMFIHDAWGVCVGNASDMRSMADRLDDFSGMIAGAYASRAGGTNAQWRKKMQAETWFSPEQAVAEGLADDVSKPPAKEGDAAAARLAAPAAARRRHDPKAYPWLATESEGRDPAPASPPDPSTAPHDPQPVDDPGDAGPVELPAGLDIAALFREGLTAAAEPPVAPIAGDEIAALITYEAEHRPADPPSAPAPAPTTIDPIALATALKEGLHS